MWPFSRPKPAAAPASRQPSSLFSTNGETGRRLPIDRARALHWPVPKPITIDGATTDANDVGESIKASFVAAYDTVPEAQFGWYAAQGFIGYQLCSMISQHWLVGKACSMPAKDAVRNGWELASADGVKIEPKVLDFIRDIDIAMKTKSNAQEYIRFGKIFGIRVALTVVENGDDDWYKNPFNIDGIGPGEYKGISQIDPYWIVPQLTADNVNNPGSIHFYEPEYWILNGKTIHRSHLIIYVPESVSDVLKPAYYYGGISIPQKIFERVYAAERTANEAPQLAMTKRMTVMHTDMTKVIADQAAFDNRMQWYTEVMNNYGTRFIGEDDTLEQHDTSLTDLDSLIMTQYQIVAAIAEVPGTKLLGTQPKGFNSTGEFEESSYHETLEGIQDNDITPLLMRHYHCVVASYVKPKFGKDISLKISWNALDAMTGLEQAQLNLAKAQTDAALEAVGAIDAQDIRNRVVNDKDSGYVGLPETLPPLPDEELEADKTNAATIKGTVPKAKPVAGA